MRTWRFVEGGCRLVCDGEVAQITPKAASILSFLMDNPGRVVTRDELLDAVWPGLHVSPDLVREYVFDLRSALGDDASAPRYIETLRGRGIRLIGGVVRVDEEAAPSAEATARRHGPTRATVAVLCPHVDGDDTRLDALARTVADEIIGEIGRYEDVAVVARAISFAMDPRRDLRESAGKVGAGYLVESAFSQWRGMVRARFRLIDARGGQVVWSGRFEGTIGEPVALSDSIMTAVVNAIVGWQGAIHRVEFKLISRRDEATLGAFEHFIRACDIDLRFDAAGVRRSLAHLSRSLELDDRYARCWLIRGVMLRWGFDALPEADPTMLAEADAAIDRAFALDPDDPATLALVALRRARAGDIPGAEDAARRAAADAGADADACIASTTALALVCGDMDSARASLDRAFEMNPSPPGYYRLVEARVAFFLSDYDRSIAASRIGLAHVSALAFRALSQARLGRAEEARESWEAIAAGFPRFSLRIYADEFPVFHPSARLAFDAAFDMLKEMAEDVR